MNELAFIDTTFYVKSSLYHTMTRTVCYTIGAVHIYCTVFK